MPTVVGEMTRNAVFAKIVELGGLGTNAPTAKTLSSDRLALDTDVAVYVVAAQSGTTDDIDGISGFNEGQFIILRADAGDTLTLKDENAGAAANTDKIRLPSGVDVLFTDDEAVLLYHDDTLDRWVLLGGPIAAGAHAHANIQDADGDTKIQVEESADEDIIRFDAEGTEMMAIGKTEGVDIFFTADTNDEHAMELHVDAAAKGDVKAIDIDYITGAIASGEDEAIILANIIQFAANGGQVFALEALSTDGGADAVYAVKAGAVVGVVLQESGTFANPTTGTNDTPSTDVPDMIDGSEITNTTIFVADNDYILIGAAAPFTEIEFDIETGANNPGIKPTFGYSTAGSHLFTAFSPVDGTDGFRNSGIVAWDADDLTAHAVNTDTGTYDIKITRTHAVAGSASLFFAKTAATVVYKWDKDGIVTISSVVMRESSDHPETPAATFGQVWVKNTDPTELWYTDDAGTDVQLGTGGGGGNTLDEAYNEGGAAAGRSIAIVTGEPMELVVDDAAGTEAFVIRESSDTEPRFSFSVSSGFPFIALGPGGADSLDWVIVRIGVKEASLFAGSILSMSAGAIVTANGIIGEIITQVFAGTPTHSASEGVVCWDSTNNKLYVNSDGGTTWQEIGAGGGHDEAHGPSQHTEGTAWRDTYQDVSGDDAEIVLGASGTFKRSAGASSAPAYGAIQDGDVPGTHAGTSHHSNSNDHANTLIAHNIDDGAHDTGATGAELDTLTGGGETALHSHAGGAGGHTIQDEGGPLTARANLDFVGAGVVATDGGAGPDSTIVTIAGGGGSGTMTTVEDTGAQVGGADIVKLNFEKDFIVTESPNTEISIELSKPLGLRGVW